MERYLVLPNTKKPKYILPLLNKEVTGSSLNLYVPFTLLRKIQVFFLRLFIRLEIASFFIPERWKTQEIKNFLPAEKHFSFGDWLCEILKVKSLKYAIYTGAPGYYRKTTVQIMSNGGQILGYAKVATSPQTWARLRREAEVLEVLRSLTIPNAIFPKILAIEETHQELIVLQSAPSANYMMVSIHMTDAISTFLSDMFNRAKTFHNFAESLPYKNTNRRIMHIIPKVNVSWKERFQKATKILSERMSNVEIPCGLCHYDFKPWNLRINERSGRLFVFDWELARTSWTPLTDYFHFIIQPAILVNRMKPECILERILNPPNSMRKSLLTYIDSIDMEKRLYLYIFLFYLLDASSFCLEKALLSSDKDAADTLFISQLGSLFSLCIDYMCTERDSVV